MINKTGGQFGIKTQNHGGLCDHFGAHELKYMTMVGQDHHPP